MFKLFRKSSLAGSPVRGPRPVTEWSPVATGEIVAAFLRQLVRTGRFLGTLNTRKGFSVRTMLDGSEQAVSRDTLSRVDISAHEVSIVVAGLSPRRAAFAAMNPILQTYLSLPSEWIETTGEHGTTWATQVPIRNAAVLSVECQTRPADPLAVPQADTGTRLVLSVRKMN